MRQGIAAQRQMIRALRKAAIADGLGDAAALRKALDVALQNLDLALECINEIDDAPVAHGYDMLRGGRQMSGVNSSQVDNAVSRVAQRLRSLPIPKSGESSQDIGG